MTRLRRRLALWAVLFAPWVCQVPALGAGPADHPPLVDSSRTKCEVCHPDQVGGSVLHSVVSECQACHEFGQDQGRTTVTLAEDQPQLCLACHEDMEVAAQGRFEESHDPVAGDCLACHDPHSTDERFLLRAAVPLICFDCHDADALRVEHGVSVVRANCVACHAAHGSDRGGMLADGALHAPFADGSCEACHRRGLSTRARDDSSRICFACHDAERFQGSVVHAAVRRGECLACHDPHLSPNPGLTRGPRQSLCLACHREIGVRLTRATVHPIVQDSCDTCHETHVSDHAFLLSDDPSALCGSCHDAGDPDLVRTHLGFDLGSLDCSSCHDGHGSTERALLADTAVHPPFVDAACETCHEGNGVELTLGGGSELCYACHAEIEEVVADSPVRHPAMELAECRDCHSPHATRNRELKKEPHGAVCLTCHYDKRAGADEFQHGAVDRIGCEVCHEPHGSLSATLLRADIDDLCLGCHDGTRWTSDAESASTVLLTRFVVAERTAAEIPTLMLPGGLHGHPVAGHRTLGPVSEAERRTLHSEVSAASEIHCITCHDPHKGVVRQLLANGRSEICSSCHEK